MTDDYLKELLHLDSLLPNEPVPPFGVVDSKIELGLVSVTERIAEGAIRWEHIHWVSNADERLVNLVGDSALDSEWVM